MHFLKVGWRSQMVDQTDQTQLSYKRVLLKISGEALMGDQGFGLHPPTVERIAKEVKRVNDLRCRIMLSYWWW